MAEETGEKDDRLKGIDGWLIWPLVGLVLGPLYLIWRAADRLRQIAELVPEPPQTAQSIAVLLIFPLLAFQIFCLVRFLQKRREVPWLMTGLYGINIVGLVILIIGRIKGYSFPDQIAGSSPLTGHMVSNVVQLVLSITWIIYFHHSERVTNTFTQTRRKKEFKRLEKPERNGLGGWILAPTAFIFLITAIGIWTAIKKALPVTAYNALKSGDWMLLVRNGLGLTILIYGVICLYAIFYKQRAAK
jgi:hypothetical protein